MQFCFHIQHLCFFKGILSTTIVIFSYPKLLSFSVLTLIKWRLTPSYAANIRFFDKKKDPKLSLSELLSRITKIEIYSSIHLFIWPSMWTRLEHAHCLETMVLGQKRECRRVEESGLWRIQRERWIEVKYLPNGTSAGYM